jgi:long-chain acyl-CoA synthetase
LDLLTLRAAAGGGSIDGHPAASLVAAGFTLLQRSPVLVRALAGKRAAILLPTSPQYLVALAAADGRGAVLVNPLAAPAEVAYQLADANVGAVLTIAALTKRLPSGTVTVLLDESPAVATVVAADGHASRVDLGSHFGLDVEGDAEASGRDEECAIVYTSAMAGRALGAILTHRNLITNARQTVQAARFTPDDRVLAVLPFSHLFGLTTSGIAPLLAGARVLTMARFNPVAAVDRLVHDGITTLVGVPAVFAAMLAAIERRDSFVAPALELCICGGAALDRALQDRWADATGVELRQGYGLTEASPVALFNRIDHPNRRGTLGLPFPGVRVSIRDRESGAALPTGSEGEICIAGDTVFRGYVRHGEQGLRVRDGWLHTGDRGLERPDGAVEFRGLYKAMFTRNGFNVYPREVERVLGAMPGVTAVRVYGIADTATEHEIAAEIEGSVREHEVKSWAESHLSQYKRPARITITAAR